MEGLSFQEALSTLKTILVELYEDHGRSFGREDFIKMSRKDIGTKK